MHTNKPFQNFAFQHFFFHPPILHRLSISLKFNATAFMDVAIMPAEIKGKHENKE